MAPVITAHPAIHIAGAKGRQPAPAATSKLAARRRLQRAGSRGLGAF